MIKIKEVFAAYQQKINTTIHVEEIFGSSGMVNQYQKLDYGFFPLGSGILTAQSKTLIAEIAPRGIMFLGNDFGTTEYLIKKCPENREKATNPTIRNLLTLDIDVTHSFFTNFYLGLRDNVKFPEMGMTQLSIERKELYQKFCYDFFLVQLEIINPKTVVCMGKDTAIALYKFGEKQFPMLSDKKPKIKYPTLYKDGTYQVNTSGTVFGNRKFVFIPHPSYAHMNWSPDIKTKFQSVILDE